MIEHPFTAKAQRAQRKTIIHRRDAENAEKNNSKDNYF
jgi:hypothetical protein